MAFLTSKTQGLGGAMRSGSKQPPSVARAGRVVAKAGVHPTQADVDAITAKVKESVKHAEEVCAKGTKENCAVAWDEVEELSAAAAHKKMALKADPVSNDPLEAFCEDNPDADECRVYDD